MHTEKTGTLPQGAGTQEINHTVVASTVAQGYQAAAAEAARQVRVTYGATGVADQVAQRMDSRGLAPARRATTVNGISID